MIECIYVWIWIEIISLKTTTTPGFCNCTENWFWTCLVCIHQSPTWEPCQWQLVTIQKYFLVLHFFSALHTQQQLFSILCNGASYLVCGNQSLTVTKPILWSGTWEPSLSPFLQHLLITVTRSCIFVKKKCNGNLQLNLIWSKNATKRVELLDLLELPHFVVWVAVSLLWWAQNHSLVWASTNKSGQ